MRRLRRISDIVNILMISMCICAPAMGILDITTQKDSLVYIILLPGLFVINLVISLMRIRIKKIIWFILGHVGLCALMILLCLEAKNIAPIWKFSFSDVYGCTIIWAVYSILMLFTDIGFWINAVNVEMNLPLTEKGEKYKGYMPIFKEGFYHISVAFVAVFVVMMFLAIYLDYDRFKMFSYVLGIVYIGLYLIRIYLKNVSGLVDVVEIGNGVTQKKLVSANTKMVIPFIVLLILAMILFQSDKVIAVSEQLAKWIVEGFILIILAIIALFSGGGDEQDDAASEIYSTIKPEYGSNPEWLDRLCKILEYALTAALIILVLYFLVKFVIRLLNYYGARSTNSIKEVSYDDMTEISQRVRSDARRQNHRAGRLFARMNNRDRVRYLYRKMILKLSKSGLEIKKNLTPAEQCRILGVDIIPTYCKARYSNEEITDNDVAIMRGIRK